MNVKKVGTLGLVALLAVAGSAFARDAQRPRSAQPPRASQPHTRTTERQRTDTGHTRTDTWTGADGRTATRDAVVSNDPAAGTRTRNVDYTGPNGKTASVDSVRTRTDDGFTRNTTETNAAGKSRERSVDVSCDKDARKCVKQVEVSPRQ